MVRAIDIFEGADRELWEAGLRLLSSGKARHVEVASALNSEARVSSELWTAILEVFLHCRVASDDCNADLATLEAELVEVFRAFSLTGQPLALQPKVLGRIRQFEILVDQLYEYGIADSIAEDLLWSFTRGDELAFAQAFPDLPLGRHIIWSTFSKTEDPFAACEDVARLPNELGLPLTPAGREVPRYLMFAYATPGSARVATIADAFAGGFNNTRFRPFGKTHPTRIDSGDEEGRAECVHVVISARHLVRRPGGIPTPGWAR